MSQTQTETLQQQNKITVTEAFEEKVHEGVSEPAGPSVESHHT